MKSLLKLASIFIITFICISKTFAGTNEIAKRLVNPVYVVLEENNPTYNTQIKYAIENYWTASVYEFISKDEFKLKAKEDANLFIKMQIDESIDGGIVPFPYSVQLFYFVRVGSVRNPVTGVPFKELSVETAKIELVNAIRILQDKLNFKLAKESEENSSETFTDAVNLRTNIIKTKKLYLTQDDLGKGLASIEEIKQVYSGEVYIISQAEMNKIIDSKQSDAVYANVENYKSGITYTNFKQIVDASTGLVLYNDESKTTKATAITSKDLERIQK